MREHEHLAAVVGFVGEHVAEHFGANRPGSGPGVADELRNAAASAERFSEHLIATSGAFGQSGASLFRSAAGAMKLPAIERVLPGGLAFHAAGCRCWMIIWFMRSFAAKMRSATRPRGV